MKSENLLRNIYIALMIVLFALIVSTPILVDQGISILDEEIKEMVEAGMLFVLVFVGFVIYFVYKRRLKQRERQLDETLSYIGAVNLQVDQVKSIFDTLIKYPESKKDFRYLFESLANKALAGVNGDWVLFRIIDTISGKTLSEYSAARGSAVLLKCEISNKDLLKNKNLDGCWAIASMQENFGIKVFCIMPVESVSENQEVLLKAIVNNLGMLYLIFVSASGKP
ncbi:MAG: hypothetical protein V1845_04250 [bacterium]